MNIDQDDQTEGTTEHTIQDESNEQPEIVEFSHPSIPESKPWGFWATLGFSVLAMIAYFIAQVGVVIIYVIVVMFTNPDSEVLKNPELLESNGLMLCLATAASAVVCIPVLILFAWMKKNYSIRDYLALHWFDSQTLFKWVAIFTGFIVLNDSLMYITGQPVIPQFMVDVYSTTPSLTILLIGIVIMAPLVEEFFFRGFLFQGLYHTRLGGLGTVIVTAIPFGLIHIQYDWIGIFAAMIIGVLLGMARWKTGSLYVAIMLHMYLNLVACIQVICKVHWMS